MTSRLCSIMTGKGRTAKTTTPQKSSAMKCKCSIAGVVKAVATMERARGLHQTKAPNRVAVSLRTKADTAVANRKVVSAARAHLKAASHKVGLVVKARNK